MSKFFSLIKFTLFTFLVFVFSSLILLNKAYAFSGLGAGSQADPFQITTCAQLQEVNDALTASYVLMNDIDCSATTEWNTGAGFIPLGNEVTPFSGYFGGQNYTISSLWIQRNSNYIGLFGYISEADIIDVEISVQFDINNTVDPVYYIGGLAGYSYSSFINGVTVRGEITQSGTVSAIDVGGIIGYMNSSYLIYSYAGFSPEISSTIDISLQNEAHNVGGLVGYIYGLSAIQNSVSNASIVARDDAMYIGGIVGYVSQDDSQNFPFIQYTSFEGIISADAGYAEYIGGFAGYIYGGIIEDSFSNSHININYSNDPTGWVGELGGFVGYMEGGTISRSHSYGEININGTDSWGIGGFVGYFESTSLIEECSSEMSAIIGGDDNYIGGFVGDNHGVINDSFTTTSVQTGFPVDPYPLRDHIEYPYAGGFSGRNATGAIINNSYSNGFVSGIENLNVGISTTITNPIDSSIQTIIVDNPTGIVANGYLVLNLEKFSTAETTITTEVNPGDSTIYVSGSYNLPIGHYFIVGWGTDHEETFWNSSPQPINGQIRLYNEKTTQFHHDIGELILVVNKSEVIKVLSVEGNTLTVTRRIRSKSDAYPAGTTIESFETDPIWSRGGFNGKNEGDITNSYWNITTSGLSNSYGGTGLTTAEMALEPSFSGWDFTDIWSLDADTAYGAFRDYNYPVQKSHLPPNYSYRIITGEPSIIINNGNTYTNSSELNLALDAPGAGLAAFSSDGGNTWNVPQIYSANTSFLHPGENGEINLRVKFFDLGKYETAPDGASDSIILNTSLTDDDVLAINTLIYLIDALPPVNELTLDNADQVSGLRDAYDALSPANQALIINYATLTAAEARIAELTAPPTHAFRTSTAFRSGQYNWSVPNTKYSVSGDFNGDNKDEIAAMYDYGNNDMSIIVFAGDGTTLSPASWFRTGPGNWGVANTKFLVAGDFNGDGKDEIAAMYDYGNNDMSMIVFNATGNSFSSTSWFRTGPGNWGVPYTKYLVAGDFNTNGTDEIAAMYDYGNNDMSMIVFTASGTTFSSASWFRTGPGNWGVPYTKHLVTGDFNSDNKDEIAAMYDYGNNDMSMIVFNATGTSFSSTSWFRTGPGNWGVPYTKYLVAGDFNFDGKDEISAMYDYGNNDMSMIVFTATNTTFRTSSWFRTGPGNWGVPYTKFLSSGDYDGDGYSEVSSFYDYGLSDMAVIIFGNNTKPVSPP